MSAQIVSLPEKPGDVRDRIQLIVEWWNALRVSGDSGATTWDELEKLEQQVTENIARLSAEVEYAESLTAHAMLLIAGCTES